jgi:hypothetical protein
VTAILTNATKNALLDSAVAGSLAAGTPFLSAHTGFPPAGGNELTGGSPAYARKSITWSAAASGSKDISAAVTFDVPAGTTVRAVALYDASTAGTQRAWMPVGSSARRAVAVTDATDVTNNDLWSPAHGLAVGNSVIFWATIGAALPGGLSEDTEYFVISAGLTTDSFRVSTTLGGSVVDITSVGDGDVQKFTPEVFAGQGTYQVTSFAVSLPG